MFKLLGIHFDTELSKLIKINYKDKLDKIKIKNWQRRQLTPIGKITVIKTLLIPMLNHLFILLPNPPVKIIKELNETKLSNPVIPHHLQIYLKNRKGTKDMYNIPNQSCDEATG